MSYRRVHRQLQARFTLFGMFALSAFRIMAKHGRIRTKSPLSKIGAKVQYLRVRIGVSVDTVVDVLTWNLSR